MKKMFIFLVVLGLASFVAVGGELWTCAMHPQIQLPKPGLCPICGMELIPMKEDTGKDNPRQYPMNESARKLAEVETAPVERKWVPLRIRMVGKIDFDETRIRSISARVNGRLDRLFVDYTGVPVKKGDHLGLLYSPELLTAQEELLEAIKAVGNAGAEGKNNFLVQSNQKTLESSREKLRLWGVSEEQIQEIEKQSKTQDHIVLTAPIGGVVIKKEAMEGTYVMMGSPIYTIADLSHLWVKLDVYESDIQWIRYGQEVEIETEAYPGAIFKGQIAFIDPILNAMTRTVKVRVNVENKDGKLKPEMFVRAVLRSVLASGGGVVDVRLSGKWICPMHPEVVKDQKGICDFCQMDLVTAEELGYIQKEEDVKKPLLVPETAVLRTGKRAVVYVSVPNASTPTYEGREVLLGPKAEGYFLVNEGLSEGEKVVVRGNFLIDSAMQIQAKPSMMSIQAEDLPPSAKGEDLKLILEPLYVSYFEMQRAMSEGKEEETLEALKEWKQEADHALSHLSGTPKETWESLLKKTSQESIEGSALKVLFAEISRNMIDLEKEHGHVGVKVRYALHCPMALKKGADWMQESEGVKNPYFDGKMTRCGSVKEKFPGVASHD